MDGHSDHDKVDHNVRYRVPNEECFCVEAFSRDVWVPGTLNGYTLEHGNSNEKEDPDSVGDSNNVDRDADKACVEDAAIHDQYGELDEANTETGMD